MKIGSAIWMILVVCALWSASGLSWVLLVGISLLGLGLNILSRFLGGPEVERDRFGHWIVKP